MAIITFDGATAEIFEFRSKTNAREYHVMIHAKRPLDTFQEQYMALRMAAMLVQKEHLNNAQPVMKRYFVSDATNQALFIKERGAVSIIQQPPLDGTKVALWMNWIVRGQADYGYLIDAAQLKYMYNRLNSKSPYKHSAFVSGNAYAIGIEAGYDVFSQIQRLRADNQKLYVFGRYEQYNPYASNTNNTPYDYTEVKRLAIGVNYHPIKQIAIKAEYSNRFLKSLYNDEPSVNIGVAYEGWFDLGHKRATANDKDINRLNQRINDLQRQLNDLKKSM